MAKSTNKALNVNYQAISNYFRLNTKFLSSQMPWRHFVKNLQFLLFLFLLAASSSSGVRRSTIRKITRRVDFLISKSTTGKQLWIPTRRRFLDDMLKQCWFIAAKVRSTPGQVPTLTPHLRKDPLGRTPSPWTRLYWKAFLDLFLLNWQVAYLFKNNLIFSKNWWNSFMVNEAWLFTFCQWTRDCDVNVVKNYLKFSTIIHWNKCKDLHFVRNRSVQSWTLRFSKQNNLYNFYSDVTHLNKNMND